MEQHNILKTSQMSSVFRNIIVGEDRKVRLVAAISAYWYLRKQRNVSLSYIQKYCIINKSDCHFMQSISRAMKYNVGNMSLNINWFQNNYTPRTSLSNELN